MNKYKNWLANGLIAFACTLFSANMPSFSGGAASAQTFSADGDFSVVTLPTNLIGDVPRLSGTDDVFQKKIDHLIEQGLTRGHMPGAVICIGNSKKVVYQKAYGFRALQPEKAPMQIGTLFDLASLTKPIATATSIMVLLEDGKVRLRDKVDNYLPEFAQNGKRSITIHQLLTHSGGLIPDNPLSDYREGKKIAMQRIFGLKPTWEPGSRFAYTDVGFIVLGEIVEKQSGESLAEFSRTRIFQKLGMTETTFNPSEELRRRAAVTQKRNDKWIQGEVHDPRAYEMGGVAGHAGLFSTAADLSRYCQMFLSKGYNVDSPVLSPATMDLMTTEHLLPGGVKRGLGWDKLSPYSSNRGELMSKEAFGHGGFTGTSLWIDPQLDLFVVFLSHRVHPDGKGSVNRLAGKIGTIAAAEFSRRKSGN